MTRFLGFLIAFFGVFALSIAAPDREKRQTINATSTAQQCREIYNLSCDSLSSISTPPPLNTALPETPVSDCECVIYYLCSSDGTTMNTDGAFVIDKRFGEKCPGTLDVCCQRSSIVSSLPNVTTPTVIPTPSPVPTRSGCGYRNPNGVTVRITGKDNQAQFGEFPWMVAVLRRPETGSTRSVYECGGSLIHPRVILTAAHTVEGKNPADLVVRAGEWDTQTRSEPILHQERDVEAIIIHEKFNTNNLHNDFAILILRTPFDITPSVNTICLPQESDIFDATRCIATGWGKDNFEKEGRFQAVLKQIELPVVPSEPCQTFLRLTRLGKPFILDQSFICAGGEAGLDTCTGDGGSPLACPIQNTPDRYVQAGIVAWGIGCGADRTPGVYGSVAKARQWIDSKLAQYNIDRRSFDL